MVFEFEIVGLPEVFQQTPFAVIGLPPSEMVLPPELAEFKVIELGAIVIIVGIVRLLVVMELSKP